MKISPSKFFGLPAVKHAQRLQRNAKRFGDRQHRSAHIKILELADKYGVTAFFESLEAYDKANAEMGL